MPMSSTTTTKVTGTSLVASTGFGGGQAEDLRPRPLDALPQGDDDVTAVERQQRDEVEDEQRDVQRGDEPEHRRQAAQDGRVLGRHLAGDDAHADDAQGAVGVAFPARDERLGDRVELDRQLPDDARDGADVVDRGLGPARSAAARSRPPGRRRRTRPRRSRRSAVLIDDGRLVGRGGRDHAASTCSPSPLHHDRELPAGRLADDRGRLVERRHLGAVDRDDHIAGQHARRGRRGDGIGRRRTPSTPTGGHALGDRGDRGRRPAGCRWR